MERTEINSSKALGVFCILVVFALLAAYAPPATASLSISGESYSPVLWGAGAIGSQFVEYSAQVTSDGSSADRQFLNVIRDDGTWIVQNLPVGYEPGTSNIATNFDSSLFADGASYQTTLSATPDIAPSAYSSGASRTLGAAVNYLANTTESRTGLGTFSSPGLPSTTVLSFGTLFDFAFNIGMPDLTQGLNECAPTSAANSLTWLSNSFKDIKIDLTTVQIRDKLKDADHMKTDPATGTSDSNFISGKKKFVTDNKLPIETHIIKGGAGGPSIANIIAELKKGQDVELAMSWGRGGGHWITLVGLVRVGNSTGIWFNDPDDGKTQTNFSWLDGDNGFTIRSYGATNGGNVVDLAVAESRIPAPGAFLLAAIGTGAIGWLRRRKAI